MSISNDIRRKMAINPNYVTNRKCPVSFTKFKDLEANPRDLTNFASTRNLLCECVPCKYKQLGSVQFHIYICINIINPRSFGLKPCKIRVFAIFRTFLQFLG